MSKVVYVSIFAFLFISCNSDIVEVLKPNNEQEINQDSILKKEAKDSVVVLRNDFEYEDGTRVALTKTNKGMTCTWSEGDELGIIPLSDADAETKPYRLTLREDNIYQDAHFARFTSDKWRYELSKKYAAYYPYRYRVHITDVGTSVTVRMTGQNQYGDDDVSRLKTWDYMFAPSTFVQERDSNGVAHNVAFEFKHMVAIMELHLNMPVPERWSKIIVENADSDKVFVTEAKLNALTGEIQAVEKSSSISLEVYNLRSTSANHKHTFYIAALPTTTGELCIKAVTDEGAEFMTYVDSKTLHAGKIYRYTDNRWEVDLGLSVNWSPVNVGSDFATENGYLFAWGETEPQEYYVPIDFDNIDYGRENYKWLTAKGRLYEIMWPDSTIWEDYGTELWTEFTKYTYSNENGNLTKILKPEDDAATQSWGGRWRMPSCSEDKELNEETYWKIEREYIPFKGNADTKIISRIPNNKNFVYLKAQQYYVNDGYWLSELSSKNINFAYTLKDICSVYRRLSSDGNYVCVCPRWVKNQVRPVCEKRKSKRCFNATK